MLDVDQAPESPGLYAWYATFQATAQDWKIKPDGLADGAIGSFLDLIRRYASYHEPLPIDLDGKGAYGTHWQGALGVDFPLRPVNESGDQADAETDAPSNEDLPGLRETLGSEHRRRIMALLLRAATPTFSSPLYIGVTDNLRSRLRQHKKDFERTDDWLRKHPEDIPIVRSKGKSFGQRAAARRISMNHLVVWVIHLDETNPEGISQSDIRQTAASTEWILHRLYTPVLGKQ